MKISELLTESDYRDTTLPLDKYRGPYDPRTMEPYSDEHTDSSELTDIVDELIDGGVKPELVALNPKTLIATQDWLSDYGSDEAMFPEYQDRPVVLKDMQKLYILDGHHRVAQALKLNKMLKVYLFDELA
jgi:hypothetical protein